MTIYLLRDCEWMGWLILTSPLWFCHSFLSWLPCLVARAISANALDDLAAETLAESSIGLTKLAAPAATESTAAAANQGTLDFQTF